MTRREPPHTDEGWYALHDLRTIDWDAWRDAPQRTRDRAIEEGTAYLDACESIPADEGTSAVFSVLGTDADLLVVHLRPSLADLDTLKRRFEHTALAEFTDRTDSFVSVTEASGYGTPEFFEEGPEAVDPGIRRYIESRLEPRMPDAEYLCFYPMDKRRDPEHNWYDLPFDERADHMSSHGDIGREYAGKVTQIVTSAIGFDDWEWGVTLFADDPKQVKRLLYEMRFDPSTSLYAEFGPFYFARRFPPADLGAFLAGEHVGTGEGSGDLPVAHPDEMSQDGSHPHSDDGGHPHAEGGHAHAEGGHPHAEGADGHGGDDTPEVAGADEDLRERLDDLDVYAGQPHGEDVYALVLYSEADPDELFDDVDGLRANFDHYDTHVKTAVYEGAVGEGPTAIVSLWSTASAADTAAGFLADLPSVVGRAGEGDGFGTMGMFYTVKPDHRGEFVDTFAEVGGLLDEMDGHRESRLLANRENENDMFIASEWDSREDALGFFSSEEFAETVRFGREVLDDRPRHVFLA